MSGDLESEQARKRQKVAGTREEEPSSDAEKVKSSSGCLPDFYAPKHNFKTIDIHTHILPENIPDLRKRYGYGEFLHLVHHDCCKAKMYKGDKFFREIEENCYRAEPRIKDSDDLNINVQVLSTVPVMFSYWAKPEDCADLCVLLNDQLNEVVKKHPTRFIGLATLPMQDSKLAIKELERIMALGFAGIEIGSHINDMPLSDPALFPIFEACERLGACIFVHPWDMPGQKLMEKYWLPWLVGMPAETSFAICSFIFGGIFERLPKLRVAFAHGGGSFPQTIGRVEHGFRVRPDLCQLDSKINPRDFCGKFWVDSLVHDKDTLSNMVKLLGHKKIVLGSDYPFPLGEVPTEFTPEVYPGKLVVEHDKLTEEQKADILWTNTIEWLGVKESRFFN